jgi:3-deoxy-D-manno-octulosonic-acid transferase
MLGLYRALTIIGLPLIVFHLKRRAAQGLEDPARWNERRGQSDKLRPEGPLIWVHAASVGEAVSVLPLIARLRRDRPHLSVMLTTGTVTSAQLCADSLPDGAFHQYFPVDRPAWVRRFLDHWRPDAILWVESDFWPNALAEIRRRKIPTALVNARLSERSFQRWKKFPAAAKQILSSFQTCLAPDADQAKRLDVLNAGRIEITGNLKDAAVPLAADADELKWLKALIGDRPVWHAASTHPGEEAIARDVHIALKKDFPDLLTIVTPRHPNRGAEVAKLLSAGDLKVARRSLRHAIRAETDIYLADTMAEMGLLYRLSTIVFVGGSLTPHGGQNLREPAKLHSAVLHGPYVSNFTSVAAQLTAAGAARLVADGEALRMAVSALLSEPAAADAMAQAASQAVDQSESVLDAVAAALDPVLSHLDDAGDAPA